jgi:hypothetical protein
VAFSKDKAELGICVEKLGFSLRRTAQDSCGIAYFTWRNGHPLCVIAGHDTIATEEIARYVLNVDIPGVRTWAEEKAEDRALEVWIGICGKSASLERTRSYTLKERPLLFQSRSPNPRAGRMLGPLVGLVAAPTSLAVLRGDGWHVDHSLN